MTYSNDPTWRKFMDAKWKEMEKNKLKPSASDLLISSAPMNYLKTEKKEKKAPVSTAPVKRTIKKAARPEAKPTKAHGTGPRILDKIKSMPEKVVKKPTIADMGSRRRAIGAMQNPTVHELREYHELSNKIEKELSDRQVKLNEDWKKS